MGRPTIYNPEVAEKIINGLEAGQSLRKICSEPNMPDDSTVCHWRARNDEFDNRCAQARARGLVVRTEEMIDIADDVTIPSDQKKHMLSARQWMAEKLIPKYSRRLEVTGKIGLEQLVAGDEAPTE